MTGRRALVALVAGLLLPLVSGPSSAAQEPPPTRADLSFDVGRYDPRLGDFPVDAVVVRGDLAEGQEVAVELRDADGDVIATGRAAFTRPATEVAVAPVVGVGRVASAGLSSLVPRVAAEQVIPPDVFHSMQGGGGSGQLALSMVLIMALMTIVFRSPLPSASSQRWTR